MKNTNAAASPKTRISATQAASTAGGPSGRISDQKFPDAWNRINNRMLPPEPLYTHPKRNLTAIRVSKNGTNSNLSCGWPGVRNRGRCQKATMKPIARPAGTNP